MTHTLSNIDKVSDRIIIEIQFLFEKEVMVRVKASSRKSDS